MQPLPELSALRYPQVGRQEEKHREPCRTAVSPAASVQVVAWGGRARARSLGFAQIIRWGWEGWRTRREPG